MFVTNLITSKGAAMQELLQNKPVTEVRLEQHNKKRDKIHDHVCNDFGHTLKLQLARYFVGRPYHQKWVSWTTKSDLRNATKCNRIHCNDLLI
jgi:hypothetical protein